MNIIQLVHSGIMLSVHVGRNEAMPTLLLPGFLPRPGPQRKLPTFIVMDDGAPKEHQPVSELIWGWTPLQVQWLRLHVSFHWRGCGFDPCLGN